jgi:FixJ family two-component response regulator
VHDRLAAARADAFSWPDICVLTYVIALSTSRHLIAFVDEEEAVRRALQRLIRSAGLDVDTFTSGAEFLDSLSLRRPDCVVLDLHMPEVNGFQVQSWLSQMPDPVPVVIITGKDSEETHQRAMEGGAMAYLRKPVDEQILLAALANAIGHHK